jgi:hypothetical protein
MDNGPCIRSLFFKQSLDHNQDGLNISILDFLKNGKFDFSRANFNFPTQFKPGIATPWELAEKWLELLTFSLVAKALQAASEFTDDLKKSACAFAKCTFWEEVQLLSSLKALNCHLLGLDYPDSTIYQLASGAVPLDAGG